MQAYRKLAIIILSSAFGLTATAQTGVRIGEIPPATPFPVRETVLPSVVFQNLKSEGDSLLQAYDFNSALEKYTAALNNTADAEKMEEMRARISSCALAVEMTGHCDNPKVLGKQRFSKEDFFLYYPLPDKSWHMNSSRPGEPIYAPEGVEEIFIPSGDRYYPMVCGDKLFFSAWKDGLGAYDLFCSRWDSKAGKWGEPENMGFPYNSPYNDYLYVDTTDGKYSVFASDRECYGKDSVYVYVLEQNPRNVQETISDPAALLELCLLKPSADLKKVDNSVAITSMKREKNRGKEYFLKVAEVNALRDSLNLRMQWAGEEDLVELREKLSRADAELQKIEENFLFGGGQTDFRELTEETDKEVVVGVDRTFLFTRKKLGAAMNFLSID